VNNADLFPNPNKYEAVTILMDRENVKTVGLFKCNSTAYQNYCQYKAIAMINESPIYIMLVNHQMLFKKSTK